MGEVKQAGELWVEETVSRLVRGEISRKKEREQLHELSRTQARIWGQLVGWAGEIICILARGWTAHTE